MPTITTKETTLFSLDAVKSYLKVASTNVANDQSLATIADAVSDRIGEMTGRKFVIQEVTEYLDAKGKDDVWLKYYPVDSIASVQTRTGLTDAYVTLSADEYEADERLGRLFLKSWSFPCGPRTTKVVYDAGYDDQDGDLIPTGLFQLGLEFAKFAFDRWSIGIGASSSSLGGAAVTLLGEPPKDLIKAIAIYKKVRG